MYLYLSFSTYLFLIVRVVLGINVSETDGKSIGIGELSEIGKRLHTENNALIAPIICNC